MASRGTPDPESLEALWAGDFGDEYAVRNADAGAGREEFWTELLAARDARRVLEIGCNVGGNLRWMTQDATDRDAIGIDINLGALARARIDAPYATVVAASARQLPFRRASFDLVFTAGVLIHQSDAGLPAVVDEMVRCSRRWVLAMEYYSPTPVEVSYRGHRGALFKRDYGGIIAARHPRLAVVDEGALDSEAWDDVTWWLFEHRGGA